MSANASGSVQLAQRREVDHDRVVVEEIGRLAQALLQFVGEDGGVGLVQHHGDQRQAGVLQFERKRNHCRVGNHRRRSAQSGGVYRVGMTGL
jgi:hypothetical protein